jgi:hypothetical protein
VHGGGGVGRCRRVMLAVHNGWWTSVLGVRWHQHSCALLVGGCDCAPCRPCAPSIKRQLNICRASFGSRAQVQIHVHPFPLPTAAQLPRAYYNRCNPPPRCPTLIVLLLSELGSKRCRMLMV